MVWMSAFGAGGSGKDTIEHLEQTNSRVLKVFAGDGAWNNPDGCDGSSSAVLVPGTGSGASYREKFAAILGAHLNGNTVAFRFNGCSSLGGGTAPIIITVFIF